jgi:hypothetical protein
MTIKEAKQLITPPQNYDDVLFPNADTNDILTVIEIADEYEAKNCTVKQLAQKLRGANDFETCKNVWTFTKKSIKYVQDAAGYERVKLANKTVFDAFGDCKSMTILEISLLRELGITAKKRFVSWSKDADVTHVYAVAILRGGEEIPMDAVHTRFNSEVKYASKIDKIMKTKVALVHGLNTESTKIPATYLNYTSMTDGEMSLQILKERLKLYAAVHSDSPLVPTWRKGITMIDNAIYKGVHGTSANLGLFGFLNPELNFVSKTIKQAKQRFAPAANFVQLEDRKHVGDGTDPLIQVTDPRLTCNYPSEDLRRTQPAVYEIAMRNYRECEKRVIEDNKMREGLNQYMPTTSHHYLYEFCENKLLENNNPLRFDTKLKITEHKRVIPNLAHVSGISGANIREWARLSVERQHAAKDLGVMSPEQAIQILMQNPQQGLVDEYGNPRVNGGFLLACAAGGAATLAACAVVLLAVAKIIAVAAKGIAGLVQVCKNKEPTAFENMDSILKVGFSATGPDWANLNSGNGGGSGGSDGDKNKCDEGYERNSAGVCVPIVDKGGDGGSSNKTLLAVGAAAAALFLLKD